MLSNFLCFTVSMKFMGATKLTLAGSSRLGSNLELLKASERGS